MKEVKHNFTTNLSNLFTQMGFTRTLTYLLTTPTKPLGSSTPLKTLITFYSHTNLHKSSSGSSPFYPKITVPRFYSSNYDGNLHSELKDEADEVSSGQISIEIAKHSEEICKMLSNLPKNQSVGYVLGTCGFGITPILVLEVLKKLSNAGFLSLAFFRWAEKQKGFKYTTESYNALIDSLGKIKQFKLIWVLVDSMKSKGLLSKDTFILIIRRYARARRVEEAVGAFERMEQFGLKPDLSDFNRFLDTMCKSRQVPTAHQVFDKMRKGKFMPDKKSYAILLEGWGQQQNLMKLDEVYREMKEEGFDPDVVAYGIIMNAYCKARKVNQAVEKLHEMKATGVEANAYIYCILINGLGSDKRLGEALKFFEMSKASCAHLEAPTYNAVVGSYCWSMKFEEAFRVVDEMRRCGVGPNSRTYDIILHHLIKAGKTEEAYSVFRRMSNEKDCYPSVSTYEIMLRMFCNTRQLNMAVLIWNQMKDKGILPGMHMYATLVNSFCHEDKLDEACKYFGEMLDVGIRAPGSTFKNLKQALLDKGKKDTVLDLARKLEAIRTTIVS